MTTRKVGVECQNEVGRRESCPRLVLLERR